MQLILQLESRYPRNPRGFPIRPPPRVEVEFDCLRGMVVRYCVYAGLFGSDLARAQWVVSSAFTERIRSRRANGLQRGLPAQQEALLISPSVSYSCVFFNLLYILQIDPEDAPN
jgi:hypothetical protein